MKTKTEAKNAPSLKGFTGWYCANVTEEYPCKWGRGAMLVSDCGAKIPASAGQLPRDFKIGQRFNIFISFGNLLHAKAEGEARS